MKKSFTLSLIVALVVIGFLFIFRYQKQRSHESKIGIKNELQLLIPSKAFLRDYQILENISPETYVVIYVDEGYEFETWDFSCPGYILGLAIKGNYSIALVQNKKVINRVDIPVAYDYANPYLELMYKNIWENFPAEGDYIEWQKRDFQDFPVEKLLRLKDYTGDGKPLEFLLTTTAGGCGFSDGLVTGYDSRENKVVLYSDWIQGFSPNNKGEFNYLFDCGDHGNTIKIERKYLFDSTEKSFKVVGEKKTPC